MYYIFVLIGFLNFTYALQITLPPQSTSPTEPDIGNTINQVTNKLKHSWKTQLPTKDSNPDMSHRNNKMLNYYGYYPSQIFPSAPPYPLLYPYEYLNSFPNFMESEENAEEAENQSYGDVSSRANTRRRYARPAGKFTNSPIYYIRLPPTPYMFVPGMGYVSQPPSFTSLSPLGASIQPQLAPPSPPSIVPPRLSPILNLPLNFISNGRPSGIYQFESEPQPAQYPIAHNPFFMDSSPPLRPQYQSKPSSYPKESSISSLQGHFLFNGRPDDVYILQNDYNPLYPTESDAYY